MKRCWIPILLCLSLVALPSALRAEPAANAVAPASAPDVAAPGGCDQQAGVLALSAAPVCPAAPAVVTNPMAGALQKSFVCCTAQDRMDCKAECGTCIPLAHCVAFECVCQCAC